MMENAFNLLIQKLTTWFNEIILLLPNLLVAFFIVVLMFVFARNIRKLSHKIISRFTSNLPINNFITGVIHYSLLLTGFILALSILHLDKAVTSILAGAGVVGIALGLAFQNPIRNTVSGFIMSYREYYNIGDRVETNGFYGTIEHIGIRVSELRLTTGELVVLPNDIVVNETFKNITASKMRAVVVNVGVSYNDDLEKVERVVKETISSQIEHIKNEDIEVYFIEYDSSSINFMLRFWIENLNDKHYQQTKSNAIIAIKKAFDKNGITIPFPIHTLDFGRLESEKITGIISSAKTLKPSVE
jgi:small-conductance mechanosensitive channel